MGPTGSHEEPIEAHLAPDDAEVEARMTERIEGQITKQVEERLRKEIMLVTEVNQVDLSPRICGFKRHDFITFLMICGVIAMIGGIVTIGLLSSSHIDSKSKSAPFGNSPAGAPVMPIEDVLLDELRSWIAPAEQDLIPFHDPKSAQSQALAWFHSDPIVLSQNRSTQVVLQRYVLAVLFFSTGGRNWFWPYFLSGGHSCSWNIEQGNSTRGVYCRHDDETVHNGTVSRIALSSNNLRGRLPWEIILLTDLERIEFNSNSISGSIPSRIHELSRLETFWAKENDLTGRLSSSFPPAIISINLRQNSLSGSIPTGWDKAMPKLQNLSLELNSFTGTVPSDLGNIQPLDDFSFFGNSLTGSVDQFFCGGFPWTDLVADCDEVECPCCTTCCYDGKCKVKS